MSLRVAFIGCVAFSHAALSHLQTLPDVEIVGIATRAASRFNADFVSLEPLARRIGCPVLLVDQPLAADQPQDAPSLAAFLSGVAPDVVYCFGWSNLLKPEVLESAPRGVIGYHPAALPRNRGRHPLIWALALGLTETASTFFVMDQGADSGDIVSQRPLPIAPDDDAASLYKRMTETALEQITEITAALAANRLVRTPQDHAVANVWRKRGPRDGEIDWRMSAEAISALTRALTWPYVGAHALRPDGTAFKVWRVEIGPPAPSNLEPGTILSVEGEHMLIKCWNGSVRLLEHDYIDPPRSGWLP